MRSSARAASREWKILTEAPHLPPRFSSAIDTPMNSDFSCQIVCISVASQRIRKTTKSTQAICWHWECLICRGTAVGNVWYVVALPCCITCCQQSAQAGCSFYLSVDVSSLRNWCRLLIWCVGIDVEDPVKVSHGVWIVLEDESSSWGCLQYSHCCSWWLQVSQV